MSRTTTIKASSRASVKVGDSFYTIEWTEERSIDPNDDIEDERANLWEVCNSEVDGQIEDILATFQKQRRK